MKKLFVILSLMLSFSGEAKVNLDSLWGIWNNPNEQDTNKLKAMHLIGWKGYLFTQPDSACYFAQLQYNLAEEKGEKKHMAKALNLEGISHAIRGNYVEALDCHTRKLMISTEIGDKIGISESLDNIGAIYINQGNYPLALEYYSRGLIVKGEIEDKEGQASSLNNIGIIYQNQGDNARAIDHYIRGLKIREKTGNKQGISTILTNIGTVYDDQGDNARAMDYYTRSLKIQEEIGDQLGASASLNNIGAIYCEQGDYDKAITFHTHSLTIKENLGNRHGISSSLNSLATVYQEKGDYDKVIDYCNQSLVICEEIGDKENMAVALYTIGNSHYLKGNYHKAIENSEKSLALSQEINSVRIIAYAANLLCEVNKKLSRYEPALEMYELYVTTRDSILSEENHREVIRQEYKHAYEKQAVTDSIKTAEANKVKDAQLLAEKSKTEQQQQQKYFLYAVLAITLLFGGIIFNRIRVTSKQKLKNLELEKQISYEKLQSATQNMREKLEIIETLENKLQSKSVESEKYRMERISTLFSESNYLNEPQWNEVILHYDRVHNNFTTNMTKRYGKITKEDIKLLILIKMGFLNKEISAIRATTIDSTKKAKQRLRAKLGTKDLYNI